MNEPHNRHCDWSKNIAHTMYIMYIIENPIIFAFQNTPGPGQLPDHLATLLQEQKQRQVKGSKQVENGAI